MSDPHSTVYDEVPYPSGPRSHSHPDRLATAALLFGLSPAPPGKCRVLEVGCGDGGNVIPMAYQLPGSRFLGIDAAAQPIQRGMALVGELGLGNVELRQADLMLVGGELGQFDYIIAHGVFSWVGPEVRRRLLALCRELLQPHGVAFISYNAQPGGRIRDIVRDMMLFHTRDLADLGERMEQARALVKFVAEARQGGDAFRLLMHAELERIRGLPPNYLFHDDLSEWNTSYYFVDFIAMSAEHELRFLSETDFFEMQDHHLPSATRAELAKLGSNRILHQQYLDFIKCRRFRQTLLCHANLTVSDHPSVDVVPRLCFASKSALRSASVDLAPGVNVQWESPRGIKLDSPFPPTKAAMAVLTEAWPARLPFVDLLDRIRSRLDGLRWEAGVADDLPRILAKVLHQIHAVGLVDFHTFVPEVAVAAGERPMADPLARLQASRLPVATNRHHEVVSLDDPLARGLLVRLDGTRDRAMLAGELDALRRETVPPPVVTTEGAQGAGALEPDAGELVERYLKRFAFAALLVPEETRVGGEMAGSP